jgi:hypothetical protein
MEGWIKLHRNLREIPILRQRGALSYYEAFIELLFISNGKELNLSLRELAKLFCWKKDKVKYFLEKLQEENLIEIKVEKQKMYVYFLENNYLNKNDFQTQIPTVIPTVKNDINTCNSNICKGSEEKSQTVIPTVFPTVFPTVQNENNSFRHLKSLKSDSCSEIADSEQLNIFSHANKKEKKEAKKRKNSNTGNILDNNYNIINNINNIQKKEKKVPTLEEVVSYFKEKGYKASAGEKFYEYYSIAGWKDSRGKEIINWKQKAIAVWFKDENKETKQVHEGKKIRQQDFYSYQEYVFACNKLNIEPEPQL